jgi:hypothetical protein
VATVPENTAQPALFREVGLTSSTAPDAISEMPKFLRHWFKRIWRKISAKIWLSPALSREEFPAGKILRHALYASYFDENLAWKHS